ncbi:MAG TPA: YiiD C-terminal domain-containing protein [Roseiflexaceae bacterium]|nr:YiiD C-terminal domain-containing protein [Roseiflexaceae bacterium]
MIFAPAQLRLLEDALASEIPISRAIGLTVAGFDDGILRLIAPLAPNINHKDTAFAGSLNAVLTLAGWSMLWLVARRAAIPAKVVIQDSTIHYLHPVTRDFAAECRLPGSAEVERFLLVLRKKGRARMELAAEIREHGRQAVAFSGRYVVQRSWIAPAEPVC